MSKIIVDTEIYKEFVSDLNTNIQNCNLAIDSFFMDIYNMKSWSGAASEEYLERTLIEKAKCLNFCDSIMKYVDVLADVAVKLEEASISIGR